MSYERELAVIRELDRLYILAERANTPKAWARYETALAEAHNGLPPITLHDRINLEAAMDRIASQIIPDQSA